MTKEKLLETRNHISSTRWSNIDEWISDWSFNILFIFLLLGQNFIILYFYYVYPEQCAPYCNQLFLYTNHINYQHVINLFILTVVTSKILCI